MKRIGNLYQKIISIENLQLADEKARKGKLCSYGVQKHDRNREANLMNLHQSLKNKTFKTSAYNVFTLFTPKEREIYQLPYYPDRIVHHAIMNVLEPIWTGCFIRDTYSCVKGRGVHDAMRRVKKALLDRNQTRYCLKLDVKKFYPSIDHGILKTIIRRKIKCPDTLSMLDELIDSAKGVPIGNYTSQHLANLYLSGLDHLIKETWRVKYYFRYADDIVILHSDKEYLHSLLVGINNYLETELNLSLKGNYQVFPVDDRGIDFLGFVFRHTHARIRKSIKKNLCRKLKNINHLPLPLKDYKKEICGWIGWVKYSDAKHFAKLNIKHSEQIFLRTTA